MKIAIVVHGRFHAFDLARALIEQGTDVHVLTNYPKRITEQFGLHSRRVVNCPAHGLVSRVVHLLVRSRSRDVLEARLHCWFSRWALRVLAHMDLDAVHSFTGVSEEILQCFPRGKPFRSVVRGSAHIRAQARLLLEEQRRCGQAIDHPSSWMIAREVREYALADLVIVLSSFAARTFLAEGYPNERLRVLPLGSDLSRFRPGENVVQERCRRILANEPIRVLTVGSFTYQKGMYDLAHVAERLCGRFKFRFVGDCPWETHRLRRQCLRKIEFVPRQPQFGLARQYQDGDLFLFPTIQDGYAAVLAQAQASGLPLLTTTNCAGPDLIREGASGWVVPIRDSNALVERLIWCDSHREQLVRMVRDTFLKFQPRDWAQVAVDLKSIYYEALGHCQDVQDNGTRS